MRLLGRLDARVWTQLALALGGAIALFEVVMLGRRIAAIWNFTVDDAFISFRYSANMARGAGPVFNPGAPPVEGYTSWVWMLLMTLPHLMGLDVVVAAKIVGVGATAALLVATFRLALAVDWRLTGPARYLPAGAAVAWLCAYPPTAVHAVSGMETSLFASLLTAFCAAIARIVSAPTTRRMHGAAALALLVGLTRPEGHLAVISGALAAGVMLPRARRTAWARALVVTYVVPAGLYALWRVAYYRLPFPLPFYVKLLSQSGLAGRDEVRAFLRFLAVAVGPAALVGGLWSPRALGPPLATTASLIVFYLLPRHVMSFDWRYLFPVAPVIFVLAASGLAVLQQYATRPPRVLGGRALGAVDGGAAAPGGAAPRLASRRALWAGRAACVALYASATGWALFRFGRDVAGGIASKQEFAELITGYVALGRELHALGPTPDRYRLAIADAGAIPYYSEWQTIDLVGLNNAAIARAATLDPRYVLAQLPDLIILNSKSLVDFDARQPVMQPLYSQALQEGFDVVRRCYVRSDYYLWILGRRTNALVRPLRESETTDEESGQVALLEVPCPHCGAVWRVQADLESSYPLQVGYLPFPADARLRCGACGTVFEIEALRRETETRYGKTIVPQVPSLVAPDTGEEGR